MTTIDESGKKTTMLNNRERRESILNAACRLFARDGYDAVSTKELAAEVGCSQALLFRYFPSKNAIYDTLFQEMYQINLASISLPQAPGESARQWLRRFHDSWPYHKDNLARPYLRSAVESRISRRKELDEAIQQAPDLVSDTLLPIFLQGRSDGTLPARDAGMAACVFWALEIGLQVIHRPNRDYHVPSFEDMVHISCSV